MRIEGQIIIQMIKSIVADSAAGAINDQKTGVVPAGKRLLGDQFLGQMVKIGL